MLWVWHCRTSLFRVPKQGSCVSQMIVGILGHLRSECLNTTEQGSFWGQMIVAFVFFNSSEFSPSVLYGLFLVLSSSKVVISEGRGKFCSRQAFKWTNLLSFHIKILIAWQSMHGIITQLLEKSLVVSYSLSSPEECCPAPKKAPHFRFTNSWSVSNKRVDTR